MEEEQIYPPTMNKQLEKQKQKKIGEFIRGPIQLLWLTQACRLSKSAMRVALAICFLRGIHGDTWFKLESGTTKKFHLNRQSKSRGLQELKEAGLIEIKQKQGALPIVKMVDCSAP